MPDADGLDPSVVVADAERGATVPPECRPGSGVPTLSEYNQYF
jgi:hypothetical protein